MKSFKEFYQKSEPDVQEKESLWKKVFLKNLSLEDFVEMQICWKTFMIKFSLVMNEVEAFEGFL